MQYLIPFILLLAALIAPVRPETRPRKPDAHLLPDLAPALYLARTEPFPDEPWRLWQPRCIPDVRPAVSYLYDVATISRTDSFPAGNYLRSQAVWSHV